MGTDSEFDEHGMSALPPHLVDSSLELDQLLGLAGRYHLGGLKLPDKDISILLEKLKQSAKLALELGDGRKIGSVRVERKLDGSISIFFGI